MPSSMPTTKSTSRTGGKMYVVQTSAWCGIANTAAAHAHVSAAMTKTARARAVANERQSEPISSGKSA